MKSARWLFISIIFVLLFFSASLNALFIIDSEYRVTGDNDYINDDVLITSSGSVVNHFYNRILTVTGYVHNEGSLSDTAPYHLTIRISGDVINDGNWSCGYT